MSTCLLIPVKDPETAKRRMSPLLDTAERAALARAMLRDLANALGHIGIPVVVVTHSEDARRVAHDEGWRVMWERNPISESASVDHASRRLAGEKISAVLRIPADIPLLRAEDVMTLLRIPMSRGSSVIVPSRDGRGTNALLRCPPDLFPSRFGANSFVLHRQEALRAAAELTPLDLPRLGLDLDEPDDISELFRRKEPETVTSRLLRSLKIEERIEMHAGR